MAEPTVVEDDDDNDEEEKGDMCLSGWQFNILFLEQKMPQKLE